MSQNMFCYQCQETAGCTGCTNSGVAENTGCGCMQDLLVYVTRGISAVTTHLRSLGQEISAENQSSHHREPVHHHHQC